MTNLRKNHETKLLKNSEPISKKKATRKQVDLIMAKPLVNEFFSYLDDIFEDYRERCRCEECDECRERAIRNEPTEGEPEYTNVEGYE